MAGQSPQNEFTEKDLRNWKLLEQFQCQLEQSAQDCPLHPTFQNPKRGLLLAPYLTLFLFGLLNPVVRTMRGLCLATHLPSVQEAIGYPQKVSLGSFSEIQHVVDPKLLEKVFEDFTHCLPTHKGDARLGQWQWLAQDGSLFEALPRMSWALFGGGGRSKDGTPNRAIKLHLSFNVLEDKPEVATITPGKKCERKAWRGSWKPKQAYIGDRAYGQDYKLFTQLDQLQSVFVLRLREQQCVINVEEKLPLTEADRQQGVTQQAWATLGSTQRHQSMRVRVVWIQTKDGPLILVTNLGPEELPAELVSLLYRKRWKIELFFRWIKCILGCRHWLAESAEGVTIQIYLALIAALLLQLYTGKRPSKRLMELIQFYLLGVATLADLQAGLEREKARRAPKKS